MVRSALEKIDVTPVVKAWFIWISPQIKKVQREIAVHASSPSVVILWEPWTWKEVAANAIHRLWGLRWKFFSVNCSAFAEHVLESELFWHVRWAYTWAVRDRVWYLWSAANWTFFLDEIWDMPLHVQAKILRVLENWTYRQVWSDIEKSVEARMIFATNKDLKTMVKEWTFREDLLGRLWENIITILPLRKRVDDIWHLAEFFLEKCIKRTKGLRSGDIEFDPSVRLIFENYKWPWNVRELEWVVARIVTYAHKTFVHKIDKEFIHSIVWKLLERQEGVGEISEDIIKRLLRMNNIDEDDIVFFRSVEEMDYKNKASKLILSLFTKALIDCNGNKAKAASLFNISPSGINYHIATDVLEELRNKIIIWGMDLERYLDNTLWLSESDFEYSEKIKWLVFSQSNDKKLSDIVSYFNKKVLTYYLIKSKGNCTLASVLAKSAISSFKEALEHDKYYWIINFFSEN